MLRLCPVRGNGNKPLPRVPSEGPGTPAGLCAGQAAPGGAPPCPGSRQAAGTTTGPVNLEVGAPPAGVGGQHVGGRQAGSTRDGGRGSQRAGEGRTSPGLCTSPGSCPSLRTRAFTFVLSSQLEKWATYHGCNWKAVRKKHSCRVLANRICFQRRQKCRTVTAETGLTMKKSVAKTDFRLPLLRWQLVTKDGNSAKMVVK